MLSLSLVTKFTTPPFPNNKNKIKDYNMIETRRLKNVVIFFRKNKSSLTKAHVH